MAKWYLEGAIWWSRVDPARIPLFTYLCLITSLVSFCFIHLDVLPQSCSQTTTDCTTSCLHLCVLLLALPPILPAVSWLVESGLMVEVCLCVPCPSIKLQSTSPVHISAVHVSSDPHRAGCGPALTHGTNSTPLCLLWHSSSRPGNTQWSLCRLNIRPWTAGSGDSSGSHFSLTPTGRQTVMVTWKNSAVLTQFQKERRVT